MTKTRSIELSIQSFSTHEEADAANEKFYRELTSDERLEIALDLIRIDLITEIDGISFDNR